MTNAKVLNPNRSQSLVKLVNANVCYLVAPRASGKTFAIGDRIEQLNDAMPRSQIILFSDTFKRLEERIVPNILSYFINEAGMIEGEDFTVFKKPPEYFAKPLIPLKEFDHVISFSTGMALCLASQAVPGSANAYNAQALIVDEAKYIDEIVINTEVLPALRGAAQYFGHLPEYRSHWYFTDKYGERIKWILAKKKHNNEQIVNAIVTLQLKVFQLENAASNLTSSASIYKAAKVLASLKEKLQKVRSSLVYYCDAQPYENIGTLGKKYFRDLRRDLSEYEYSISVENADPTGVQHTFYPALSKLRHQYDIMHDEIPDQPLIVAMDYNWRITPMVVGQYGILPGRQEVTLNIVNAIHTLHPTGGIDQTVKEFCDYYEDRAEHNKIVFYVYDHTATGKRPDGKCFSEIAIDAFQANGWVCIAIHMGKAPEHPLKHEKIKKLMQANQIQFNEIRAAHVLTSCNNAEAILKGGKTHKNKGKEKNTSNNPVEQTDYSDAFDMLVWATLIMELVEVQQTAMASMSLV